MIGINTTNIEDAKETKQFKQVTELKTGFSKVSLVGAGHFHSVFLSEDGRRLTSCGQNVRGQCGFDPLDDEIIPFPKLFKTFSQELSKDERVIEIHSGNSHNILRTNKALYFVGNAGQGQYLPEVGNNTGLDFLSCHEIDLNHIYDYKYENVESVRCKFDKTVITFKNGDVILFGNLLLLNEEDALTYEIIKHDEMNFKVKYFCPGINCDLMAVEY